MLNAISETLFSLVFPLHCELCQRLLPSRRSQGICMDCERSLKPIAAPFCHACGRTSRVEGESCGHCPGDIFHFDRAYACATYDSEFKTLLHGFKFSRKRYLSGFFKKRMTDFYETYLKSTAWGLVLPVPMDTRTENQRGFNQSELLSRELSRRYGIRHDTRALGCRPSERPQAALKKNERKTNAQDRFFLKQAGLAKDRDILLVDDILTTGHTASACAKLLKQDGAKSVTLLALARGR